ncbi:ATP-dependent helicase HrpB [Pseudomonas amygdali pv. lachrymans]|uniref:ATP-dependent helicase HrpB n=2 Tax=Pseudomonas amygdali pv. lachrymans TaxID=53707 RepID=A0ABR5KIC7_PSEAV|nr:ATP-dependent helicase HrpB [Pseudomonas amygdali]AXH54540.1 ATP-dependent helicase HrpB [Pseudomonas amygdali pv. lachrymans str. M301315]KPC13941.1 ATP-dependent helicase HrpB [Pseudomonas amygdali pv. lachrymans]QWA49483.1 ATP-dependent helicase HrpB [Pseudomonas amygdali pv. lachrymans]RMT18901.1 ATP-dependent helicase HrpB [Pseudomonas amygdali pv. lachrymans]
MNSLPIDAALPALLKALHDRNEVVLQAPPGAGKTTRVPLALLDQSWLAGQTIVMLEPRRLAARAAAERMAKEIGEQVGETVGYRIRLESRVGPKTRIEVVTEGILARRLQEDPSLDGIGLIIFDEFHLRNLDADLALALALNGRELFREDSPLKVLVMSATLDGESISALLDGAPIVSSEGRMYPVDVVWGKTTQPGEYVEPRVVSTCIDVLEEQLGSVLVFLPGQAEIRRVHRDLEDWLNKQSSDYASRILLCPLYGELSLSEQRTAIEPAPPGKRKVVLATNLAETSITIEGVRIVIDSGLERVPRFDPRSSMTRLATQRISKASATQRAGRAGRLEPGVCYRLWSEAQHEQLASFSAPEIQQADLAALALQLARWGVTPDQLHWLDSPPTAAFSQACDLLCRLGALDAHGILTPHGQAMAQLPAHPRIAHLLIRGHDLGLSHQACDLAALLGERDIQRGGGADVHSRMAMLSGHRVHRDAQRAKQLAKQYRSYLQGQSLKPVADPDDAKWVGCLLALAYPDRIAQQRRPGGAEYRLGNGRAAMFADVDALMKHPWLVVADLGSRQGQREERIYLAADLDPQLFESVLQDQVRQVDELDWDEREGVLRAERQRRVGELVLSTAPLANLPDEVRGQALVNYVRRKGLELLAWTPELRQWQSRIGLLRALDLASHGTSDWPDVTDASLLSTLEDWLSPYLTGVTRLSHFARLDLSSALKGLLPWPLPKKLEAMAPQTFQVPSGSNIRIDYSEQPPVLAVRLQELFGLSDTPCIANGRQTLKLHLLSPARRSVQVTQDLASFWNTTYAEVKKDLKGRYPKHYWPENPLIAEATARAKPRGT